VVNLNSKNSSDYDGIESYIGGKYESDDNSWMPNGTALCLEDGNSVNTSGADDEKKIV